MKYVDEYRKADSAKKLVKAIKDITTKKWTIMEICGGQTHSIMRFGIAELLPKEIELIHGPGCPVCVTATESVDKAINLASREDVIFCSFGDMLRVPGTSKNLLTVKSEGGDIRILYSPMEALTVAEENPLKKVVFFAVGFETTAPANAMAVYQAKERGIDNFSILVSHVLVPPAVRAILSPKTNRVQGFLAAGHVCTIMGSKDYDRIAKEYNVPIVITGFEPVDILKGIYMCVKQLEENESKVENEYSRVVKTEGNIEARKIVETVFKVADRKWRGIGVIPKSGLVLNEAYQKYDAEKIFDIENIDVVEPLECIGGLVLQGVKKPDECSAFGKKCTPEHPLGALMVSSEGACSAYHRYKKRPLTGSKDE